MSDLFFKLDVPRDDKISQELLNASPDLDEAFDLTKRHSFHWHDLGRKLKVPYNYRMQVKKSNDSDEDKLEAILNNWIEAETVPVTWASLIEALKDIDLINVAKKVKEFLAKKEHIF